ncbi:unnamed protein product [Boreogadus saida]
MAHCSRSLDVRFALERAKKKICGLEHKLSALATVSDGEENEVGALPWTQSKELKESLVDMYKANPNVNQELRQWLSPTHGCSGSTHSLPPGAALPKPQDTFQGAVRLQRSSSSPAPAPVPSIMEASPSPAPFTPTDATGHAPSSPQADGGGHAPLASPDTREKNVSFLLKELDSLRAVNSKLQLQLVHQQKEVEEHQLGEEFRTSPQLLPQAVFQELCAAQRERDQALMSRLRLANEERDEALLRAKRLQQQEEMEDITPAFNMDQDVEAVLGGLAEADSARSVQRTGAVLLALLQKARQRHRDITTQEMTVLIDERDRTATKLNRLELLTREKNQAAHDACKEELERAERERDQALEQQQQLEGEISSILQVLLGATQYNHSILQVLLGATQYNHSILQVLLGATQYNHSILQVLLGANQYNHSILQVLLGATQYNHSILQVLLGATQYNHSILQVLLGANQYNHSILQVLLGATQYNHSILQVLLGANQYNHSILQVLLGANQLQGESRRAPGQGLPPAAGPREGGALLGSTAGQEAPLTQSSRPSRQQQQDLDQRLQASLQAEGEACAKIQKLERLVEVLRKKVGTGSLRSVI